MAISFNEIDFLVARFGNKIVNEQVNLEAPTVGKGILKKENQSGTIGIVNVKQGGISSTRFIGDSGVLPDGASVDIQQLTYSPKALFTRLAIPRISALTVVSKQDGVNLVKEQMESVGQDLGRTLGRAIFSSADGEVLEAVTSSLASGSQTIRMDDVSGIRVGQQLTGFTPTGGGIPPGTNLALRVTAVDHNSNPLSAGVANVTGLLVNDDGATIAVGGIDFAQGAVITDAGESVTLGDTPTIQGSAADGMCALLDAASSTVDAGALGTTGNYADASGSTTLSGWTGNETNAGGVTLTLDMMDSLSKKIHRKRGQPWTHLIVNANQAFSYLGLLTDTRRYMVQQKAGADASPTNVTYEGKAVVVDENMTDTEIYFHNQKDVRLAEWRKFGPDYDGKKAAMVSDTRFEYDTQIFGMYNLRLPRRDGLGKITNLLADLNA